MEYTRNDHQFQFLQKCYQVVTYPTKDTWHLYIGDPIRNIIKDILTEPRDESLSLEEMKIMMT